MRSHTSPQRGLLAGSNRRGQIMVETLMLAGVLAIFMMVIAKLSEESRSSLKGSSKFSKDRSTR